MYKAGEYIHTFILISLPIYTIPIAPISIQNHRAFSLSVSLKFVTLFSVSEKSISCHRQCIYLFIYLYWMALLYITKFSSLPYYIDAFLSLVRLWNPVPGCYFICEYPPELWPSSFSLGCAASHISLQITTPLKLPSTRQRLHSACALTLVLGHPHFGVLPHLKLAVH